MLLDQSVLTPHSSHFLKSQGNCKISGLKGHLRHARTSHWALKTNKQTYKNKPSSWILATWQRHACISHTWPRNVPASLKTLHPIPCALQPHLPCLSSLLTKEGIRVGPCSAKDGVEKRSEAQEGSLASDNSGLASIPSPPGPKASGKQSGGREKPEAGRLSEIKY